MVGCHSRQSSRCMTRTTHSFIESDARRLLEISTSSPALVVTSPPYPMISMWDESFAGQSATVASAMESEDWQAAWDAMHGILDSVWTQCHEILLDGGLICVNVGDAVRTVGGSFRLFANAARVTRALEQSGFSLLPPIIWRKPTNSPTKFMGSGMLPGGAYITLEHEVIVIGRKGGLRRPTSRPERERRRRSAIFWEERNEWYSDLWSLPGVRQGLRFGAPALSGRPTRDRSAAFPFELAYRLIAMHSWAGDLVLDPFAGTGTTAAASMALARSSVSLDHDENLINGALERLALDTTFETLRSRTITRLDSHRTFVQDRKKPAGHTNARYNTPVVTSQETDLEVPMVTRIQREENAASIVCEYEAGR
jgi:modification methylase